MTMTSEFQTKSTEQAKVVRSTLQTISAIEFEKGYELDSKLKADPALLAEFAKDPAGVAKREVGLVAPEGFHMHFINSNNEYIPPEGDAINQLTAGKSGNHWSRIEIRTAVGPGCYAFCGRCGVA